MTDLVTYLRGLPDDWDSWLVYADLLLDRGDLRGEMLVLERTAALAAAESRVLYECASVMADDWMIEVGATHLCEGDVDQYATFRSLAMLADDPTPTDLKPTFARPISQLLALLEPRERGGERPGLSPVFGLQRDRVIAATLAWIDRAFDGVPVPDRQHRTIHQAEAADNYESCDRSRDHLGRWQDLPEDHLLANQWALSHLDDQGIHYYIPAAMCFALRHQVSHHVRDTWLTESLGYTLGPSGTDLRGYQQQRFGLFDRDQRAAIYAFTLVRGYTEQAAAWRRVFVAERAAACNDWFELYSPG